MEFAYIAYALFLLWLVRMAQRIFYSIYFWQLKEYRIDRIRGDFKKSLKVFLPGTALLAVAALIMSLPYELILIVFSVLGARSFFLLFKKGWKLPKFTKKGILLIVLSLCLFAVFAFTFSARFFYFIIFAEILLPLATFLLVQVLQIPTFFAKRIIYQQARNKIAGSKGLTVVGITGSYGKSSTKEFLYTILSKRYSVLKTTGNINTEIGVAQTIIKRLKPEHQVFIVEMGAYRKGEIKLMCGIAKPWIGVVTGVNEQHIVLFGSIENLLSAEGGQELAQALPEEGVLIVNGGNKHCLNLYKKAGNKNKRVYALSNTRISPDIWAEDISVHRNFISFLALGKDKGGAHFRVNVLGKQNIQNIMAAILVAKEMGMSFAEIAEASEDILQEQAGMVLKQTKQGIDIIDSSYSSNPDGVLADLEYLSLFSGKKVIVMPCLIELGKGAKQAHERIGRKIGQVCDLAVITSRDGFKDISRGAMEAGMKPENILFCQNAEDIYSKVTVFCRSGDAVLLEGRVPSRLINLLAE